MLTLEAYLLGVLTAMFLGAGVYFLRFWRETRDSLFLAFAGFFGIEALSSIPLLFVARPSEGLPWVFWIRLLASLLILGAILKKNYGE